jgi:hypothetical protein
MMIGAASLSGLLVGLLANPLAAADFGTPQEARAMLDKAVVAIKADKASALAQFNKGEGGFKDRDLYPSAPGRTACSPPIGVTARVCGPCRQERQALGKEILSVAEKARSGGRLHVAASGKRSDPGRKGELRYQDRRPDLRGRTQIAAVPLLAHEAALVATLAVRVQGHDRCL